MDAKQIMESMREGLLIWYEFNPDSKILYLSDEKDIIYQSLVQKGLDVEYRDMEDSKWTEFCNNHKQSYDYIIAIHKIEVSKEPVKMLITWKGLLRETGKLLIGTDNRLGLRYFCGDSDPYTGRSFDGIEHYRNITGTLRKSLDGCVYSKAELDQFMDEAGLDRKYFSVLPNLDFPQLFYAQDYLPTEDLSIRYFPKYNNPDTVFLEEENIYSDLVQNGLFHTMANSYFIECSMDNQFSDVQQVTLALDRGPDNSMITVIKSQTVEKIPAYTEGEEKLTTLIENASDLMLHGIQVVPADIQRNKYVMPYVEAENAVTYFEKLIEQDKNKFISEVDRFRDLILQSSDHLVGIETDKEDMGVILKKGYLDLVPLNCFYKNGGYLFFDQEFCVDNYPANAIILRAIQIIYTDRERMNAILPISYFYDKYNLTKQMHLWEKMSSEFTEKLRNQRELRAFNEKYQRNSSIVSMNRQRVAYSVNDYQRIFIDIFNDLENKKLILFGSGQFARKFITLYGQEYPVYSIADNSENKWGSTLCDIRISGPDIFEHMNPDEYKVLICVKDFYPIMKQIVGLGAKNIGVYNAHMDYPKQKLLQVSTKDITGADAQKTEQKMYHTGYIAGVFDLFHIGHLNLFKRAKELCDYLIVGVVTDEGVRRNKKTDPFIPFAERLEMVRACKYVDKAVEIPLDYSDTQDAYRLYHFDVQFSGSDYRNNPEWIAKKVFLEKQGAELVFFPYTESTSSTQLKKAINQVIQ